VQATAGRVSVRRLELRAWVSLSDLCNDLAAHGEGEVHRYRSSHRLSGTQGGVRRLSHIEVDDYRVPSGGDVDAAT